MLADQSHLQGIINLKGKIGFAPGVQHKIRLGCNGEHYGRVDSATVTKRVQIENKSGWYCVVFLYLLPLSYPHF